MTEEDNGNMTLHDWLDVVMEEAAEVAKAASKCKRFGYSRNKPGYGVNSLVLALEIGDLMGAVDQLPISEEFRVVMVDARKKKRDRAIDAKRNFGPGTAGYADEPV